MTRRRLTIAGAVVVVLAVLAGVAVAGVRWWRESHRTGLDQAMALAPDDAQRLSWTDWAGVREELGLDLGDDPSATEVTELIDRGFEADLTSTSALVESALVLQARYAFSPASVDWELFSQSEQGAAVTLGLPAGADFAEIEDLLDRLGYARPAEEDGIWKGSADLLAKIGSVTPELTFISLDDEQDVLVTSDTQAGLEAAMEAAEDGEPPTRGLGEVVRSIEDEGDPLSAAFYTGDQVCSALSMGGADPTDQDQAEGLIAAAGDIHPLTGFAMSKDPGGDLRVAMAFETEAQARTNADSRAVLAAGPAPGQGGDFGDRFTLGPVTAEGLVVTMVLTPTPGSYVLSDLSNGPLLFATC